jgi:hypothetical protein
MPDEHGLRNWLIGVAIIAGGALMLATWVGAQVKDLRHQVAGQQQVISRYRTELAHAATVISADQARVSGQHRDLITCADLQNLIWEGSGVDSAGDTVDTQTNPGPVQLPTHCVNG